MRSYNQSLILFIFFSAINIFLSYFVTDSLTCIEVDNNLLQPYNKCNSEKLLDKVDSRLEYSFIDFLFSFFHYKIHVMLQNINRLSLNLEPFSVLSLRN